MRVCSFDIENMYTNIQKRDTMNIINNIPEINPNMWKKILHILQTVTEQNKITSNLTSNTINKPNSWPWVPQISSILSETYIQHMEHKQIYQLLKIQQIIEYFWYFNDIHTIYDKKTHKKTPNEFNNLQPSIRFTIEKELHEAINFLHLTIHCKDKKLKFSIYRKPTQTDIIIPNSSCHPKERLSGINYLLNRLRTYLITKRKRNK
jgi:hypothetical protein